MQTRPLVTSVVKRYLARKWTYFVPKISHRKMEINSEDLIFGECLARIRKGRGYSQKSVALDADLDASYLAGLEHGRRPPPRHEVLNRIVVALVANQEEQRQLKEAIALTKIMKIAVAELGPGFAQSLKKLTQALRLCTPDEKRALEVIADGIVSREKQKEGFMK